MIATRGPASVPGRRPDRDPPIGVTVGPRRLAEGKMEIKTPGGPERSSYCRFPEVAGVSDRT